MVSLCYFLLFAITFYTIWAVIRIIKNSSSLILALPIVVIYYWSIYGAWSWIPMKLNGEYDYYEEIAFVVNIDQYYLTTLIVYSLFIIVFSIYMLAISKKHNVDSNLNLYAIQQEQINRLCESKTYNFIAWSLFAFFAYFSLNDLKMAASLGESAYQFSRFNSTQGSMRSLVMFAGDTFLYLSIVLLFAKGKLTKKWIIIPLILYFLIQTVLGNRNTLLCGLIMCIVLTVELYGIKRVFNLTTIVYGVLAFLAIQTINIVRGLSVDAILSGNFEFSIASIFESAGRSHEKYAAHISMYGVLKNDVEFTYGSSILALISSLLPSFLGVPRLESIYENYCLQTMNGRPDIGITVHYATGWYLNFGIIGVLLGALLWGYIVKYLYVRRYNFIYFYGSIIFAAVSVQMMRGGGLESFKGVLLNDTIIPMLIAYYCLKNKSYQN